MGSAFVLFFVIDTAGQTFRVSAGNGKDDFVERKLVLKSDIIESLQAVGIQKGQTIMVHCALSRFGFVCGSPQIVIEELLDCVDRDGTIVMPSQTWKISDPQWPGALRSGHPVRSVAAYGKHAKLPTENHDLENIFGDGSPMGRLGYEK